MSKENITEHLRKSINAGTKRCIDATELLLEDLHTYREEIRHKAGFRGCLRELDLLRDRLVSELQEKRENLRRELD